MKIQPMTEATAIAFTVTQNNNRSDLLNNFLGTTTGLSNFDIKFTGDARAFGVFGDDSFNLKSGIVLSTGRVIDLPGINTIDGGVSPSGLFNNDLSTDFGSSGSDGDSISMQIDFDAGNTADKLFFQYVFGSEELLEYAGLFNDAFSLRLNGFNLAKLTDGTAVTINNLAASPYGAYNPDFIYNPVDGGPASAQTRLDGYTQTITFEGDLTKNARNSLVINIQDSSDGIFDSAVFLKAGTLGTVPPSDEVDGDGGSQEITPSSGLTGINNFGGIGRGMNPSAETIAEVDTLKFTGAGLTAQNLLLTQNGSNLEITFEGVANTEVILNDFNLENLDNLSLATGAMLDIGNILFDGQTNISDSFDVFNVEWQFKQVLKPNTVTFLNDLNNNITGYSSNDTINGQGGDDQIRGLNGNDLLRGNLGNDVLFGGKGNDTLVGGTGDDQLIGGADTDTYVLSTGTGTDTIKGFTSGTDRIALTAGLTFEQLAIVTGSGINTNNTLIQVGDTNELLAILPKVQASVITSSDFTLI